MRHLLCQLARGAQDQGAGNGCLEVAGIGGVLALVALGRGLAAGRCFGALAVIFGADGGFFVSLLLDQRVQHGQQEGSGLARAGLAGHHQVDEGLVTTAHGQGNGLRLHGRGLGIAQIGNGADQLFSQAQFDEGVGQFRGLGAFANFHDFGGDQGFGGLLGAGNGGVQHGGCFSGGSKRGIGSGNDALLLRDIVHEWL